ncbi:MAG: (Fe-S)-binding protein [Deltaproteobacteria bacterium]|nr:(Fe-S)-binding protein [Deltaproteobacteria bacterium]
MHHPDRCNFCGICLSECKFVGISAEDAPNEVKKLAEGEAPDWLDKCVTCFACEERCPNQAGPFFRLAARMEESGRYFSPEMVDAMHAHFAVKGEFTPPRVAGRAASLCTIYTFLPPETFTGALFEGLPVLKGRFFFCHIVYLHMGNLTHSQEEAPRTIERLAATGASEIVFVHEDCYAMIKEAKDRGAPVPFKPIHLYEHLLERLSENRAKIRPLNMKAAFQRPCAQRLAPEKDAILDEIFALIGVTRVERKFDRENAICCGENPGGALAARAPLIEMRGANIEDARSNGADAMVFLCPVCISAMGQQVRDSGLPTIFLVDLCRMALGEIEVP